MTYYACFLRLSVTFVACCVFLCLVVICYELLLLVVRFVHCRDFLCVVETSSDLL